MQTLIVQNNGLVTNPSPFVIPQGSLYEAQDVNIDKPGRAETRRGFKRYGTQLSTMAQKVYNYKNSLILNDGTNMAYDSDGAGTWVNYSGSYTPEGDHIRSYEANGSFYFNSTTGVYKVESLALNPFLAGAPRALDTVATIGAGSTWFLDSNQVAYRIVWGRVDANGVTSLGTPSGRTVIANTSGATKNVNLVFPVPTGIDTSYFYQIYRSGLSGGSTIEPNDELQLVYQAYYVSGTTISVTDDVPLAVAGPFLYTSPSQDGPTQTNDQPPACKDMTVYKNVGFYANTRRKQYLVMTLLGTGAPNGIQSGDSFTFSNGTSSFTLVADVAENIATGHFLVSTSVDPAVAIQDTCRSLITVMNQYSANTIIYGYYVSGFDSNPGIMEFEARTLSGAAFHVTTNNVRPDFNPQIPASGSTTISNNDSLQNRIYNSKFSQFDAVPVDDDTFFFDVGSRNFPIDRIVAIRDSIIIFKDDGLFKLIGDSPGNYRVIRYDNSIKLRGLDSPGVLDNNIFCVTDQGITVIGDNGYDIISSDTIENKILPLFTGNYPAYATTFGVGYQSAKKYCLWTVNSTADTYPTVAYVYSLTSQKWYQWKTPALCGVISSNDGKMYLGRPDENYVRQERKTLTNSDYADNSFDVTITSSSGFNVTLTDASNVVVGNFIYQGASSAQITAIVGNILTVDESIAWANNTATIAEPISSRIVYSPITYGDPSTLKQAFTFRVLFDSQNTERFMVGFTSNISPTEEYVTLPPVTGSIWGRFVWGRDTWGGGLSPARPERTWFPREKQWHHWCQIILQCTDIFSSFGTTGIAIDWNPISESIK